MNVRGHHKMFRDYEIIVTVHINSEMRAALWRQLNQI